MNEILVTPDQTEPISHQVVEAVAEAEGATPLELEPLYDSVDPDALDALARRGSSDVAIEFTYENYRVRVGDSNRVRIESLPT